MMQCEKPESRFYKDLGIVVRNPGTSVGHQKLPILDFGLGMS